MSQPSTPFHGATVDPFLPSTSPQQYLTKAQQEDVSESSIWNTPLFSENNDEVLDDLDLTFDDASHARFDSSNPSSISTPDFSNYNFGQQYAAYPTPWSNSLHPYSLELQQPYQPNALPNLPTCSQRSLPIRSHTNSNTLHPAQPPQPDARRRSLSHGDVDRIAAAPPNPTFVRLQVPRPRATTPEEKRRPGPYLKHGKSASQSSGLRGRPLKSTSTPYFLQGGPLVGGMMPTPIGTPLDMLGEPVSPTEPDYDAFVNFDRLPTHGLPLCSDYPMFRHMTHPDDLARSRQIIEIGAMATVDRSKLDPRLVRSTENTEQEGILKKLEDVERHVQEKTGDQEVLRACTMIREALAQNPQDENARDQEIFKGYDDDDDVIEAPSKVLSAEDCGIYHDGNNDSDLLTMLMKGNNGVDATGVNNMD